jgi:EmrB/QacA subfamily drug resistance transporter
VGALLGAVFLSAIDQNIVGTALPRIAAELEGMHLYAWVFTAYMLASTLTVPIAGKLGDLRGRRRVLLAGIAIFVAGSILAGAAPSMLALIAGRAVQGMGAGAMTSSAFALVGDLFPPAERGRFMGLFSGVYALAGLIGPLAGGAIADHLGFRAVFLLNVPLGLGVAAVIAAVLRAPARRPQSGPLDWLGAVTLVVGLVPLLLALPSRDGSAAAAQVRLPALALSAVSLAFFFVIERRAEEPVVPLGLFRSRVFATAIGATFLSGAGLYASGLFVPLFLQGVLHRSATTAGLALVPMTAALVLGSIVGGQVITRLGTYRWLSVAGLCAASAGTYALSFLDPAATLGVIMLDMGVLGLGLGLTLPALSLAAQNAAPQRHLGVSTSLSQMARTLGGSIGVALFGALLAQRLGAGLVPALSRIFVVAASLLAGAAALAALLEDLPLRQKNDNEEALLAHDAASGE